jgi:hypothetical protein
MLAELKRLAAKARAEKLTPERRREIALAGASARWRKGHKEPEESEPEPTCAPGTPVYCCKCKEVMPMRHLADVIHCKVADGKPVGEVQVMT